MMKGRACSGQHRAERGCRAPSGEQRRLLGPRRVGEECRKEQEVRGRREGAPTLPSAPLPGSLGFLKIGTSHLQRKTSSAPLYSKR